MTFEKVNKILILRKKRKRHEIKMMLQTKQGNSVARDLPPKPPLGK